MKLTTYQRYQFTADIYTATPDTTSADGNIQYLPLNKVIYFEFMGNPLSVRSVIISREPLMLNSMLVGIKDKNGDAIMGNAQYKVTTIEPIINAFGVSEGYRMNLALSRESNYENLINKDPSYETVGGSA